MAKNTPEVQICTRVQTAHMNVALDSCVNIFTKVDDLAELLKRHSKSCFLYKRDLKRTYWQIAVDPCDVPLMGYGFEEHFDNLTLCLQVSSADNLSKKLDRHSGGISKIFFFKKLILKKKSADDKKA